MGEKTVRLEAVDRNQIPRIQVLISCMFQDCRDLVKRTNVQSDVLVVNQCSENSTYEFQFYNKIGNVCKARVINSIDRGLSISRNLAIANATGDICLICDDDEQLDDGYVDAIQSMFESNPEISVGAFRFKMPSNYYMNKTFWNEHKNIDYTSALKISSWQIAFKRDDIVANKIAFDNNIGSGKTKAGGEEKIFLHDCLKAGLKIKYFPISIGKISYEVSQWASNIFSEEYFVDWGYYTRRLKWGRFGAIGLSFLFAYKKRKEYKDKCTFDKALRSMLRGVLLKK
ncbi:MAG: glycosyltransferase family 2 protein [Bacteroidales bacterium]|nr:glycosyltransferase family 2 protein [Bacteroidales bacterium]